MESSRYRAVGSGNEVDETLFVSHRPKARAHIPTNSVVVSASDLAVIKGRAVLRTQADEIRERQAREAEMEEKQKAAKARKMRMLKMEEDAKKKSKKSDIEIAKIAREKTIRELATKQIDENSDLVKMLNTLGARAAAFTIRDRQLEEKRGRAHIEDDYNRRMDLVMEIDRLKDLQEREQVEEEKRAKRIADREVIVEQIRRREKQKMIAEESVEQENQQMLALIAKYQEEDRVAAEKRKIEVEKARVEVVAANEEAIRRKEYAKIREREEEEAIRLYQAKKDAAIARREKEEADLAEENKARQAKLLAQQEKSQNKQAEIDELRARRYAEEAERRARQRAREEAEIRKVRMAELDVARRSQAEAKKAMMAREALAQEREYEDAVKYSMAIMKREAAEAESKKAASESHRVKLQAQIEADELRRQQGKARKYEEGKRLREEFTAERAKLEAMRDHMVAEMERKGVNPKYLSEMKMTDIQKMQMR